ncbi:alpha/beta hydrolase [Amycolatopsis anabasis]|uniref:alpha/beta hydrolase n=1 Tax=Amycolatopsis anabasis TaxID=1840409 RepID=UPI00131B000A|nr:alpha/beta hydrolase-fold protein [Amycolatopsis anabasis]
MLPWTAVDPKVPDIPDDISRHVRDLGPLESPLIWWTLAAWGVVLLTVAVCLSHRRRLRRWSAAAAVCCLLLAGVTAVNSYVGFVRTGHDLGRLLQRGTGAINALGVLLDDGSTGTDGPGDARQPGGKDRAPRTDPSGMRIDQLNIADPAHGIPAGKTFVVLPPGYGAPANAGRRYPVVYLIHGYPYGGPEDWLTAGDAPTTLRMLIEQHVVAPMIVVSVDMTAGKPSQDWECLNVPRGPQLESYLSQTVVPTIDQQYRTVANRNGRALGGMSGGAFCALNVGLHHLDQFATLLSTLPYDSLTDDAGLLGGDQAALRANTPRTYLPTMPFPQPVAVMLAVGTGAPTDVATARRIASALQARGQEAAVHSEHGFNHTWHTARATLPYLLVFADQHFHR